MIIKPKLLSILKERGLTQIDLANAAGIPQAAVSRFDKNVQYRIEHLFRISRALNISIEELFEIIEEQEE
ncbi:helix-turn-helix transcriptional regulator [Paenibacillus sp.]|jgi:transcriptional regulator with XRE-family HTH domain|uniref:helix-turn-helix domain-containing protein n=1 Tax=Paenibacillus sp. TaxID=58172 RepID=UPI00281DD600|nr:helix-turn-helix transcriptional regulator [Paenibacillus sp.]MDR0269607.1 helix-turn-helix transcriptional regulator [Paenibacillus sp.]